MPNLINSDYILGSRFWLHGNAVDFANKVSTSQASLPSEIVNAATLSSVQDVMENVTVSNFFAEGNTASLKEATGRAEIFAATHVLTADQAKADEVIARHVAESLGFDLADFKGQTMALAIQLSRTPEGAGLDVDGETMKHIELATRCVLSSEESIQRAGHGKLSAEGKLALMNEILGITKMIQENHISEQAVPALLNGRLYDLSKSDDLLAVSIDQARTARKQFVDEEGIRGSLNTVKQAALEHLKTISDPSKREQFLQGLVQLEEQGAALIQDRLKMSSSLGTPLDSIDVTGKGDSQKHQETQLKNLRNLMRGFRFDLDVARGKKMGVMEKFRRKLDNLWNNFKSAFQKFKPKLLQATIGQRAFITFPETPSSTDVTLRRITPQEYKAMQDKTSDFTMKVGEFLSKMAVDGSKECKSLLANADEWMLDFDKAAETSTQTTHKTNSSIRYYFSGVMQRREAQAAELHEKLDTLADKGGERKATMKVSADFILGLDSKAVTAAAKAGASFNVNATLMVPTGGGPLTVRYEYGGEVHAGIEAGVGPGEDGKGVAVDAQAKAGAGYARVYEKKYDSVDEFLAKAKGSEIFLQDSVIGIIASKIGEGARKLGHVCMLGATKAGLRISKSDFDEVQYAAELHANNTLKKLDSLKSRKMNTLLRSSTTSHKIFAGAEVSASVSGISDNVLSVGGKASASVASQFGIKSTVYQRIGEHFRHHSTMGMLQAMAREFEALQSEHLVKDGTFADDAMRFLKLTKNARSREAIGKSISELMLAFEEMEAKAARLKPGDKEKQKAFWTSFAHVAKFAAVGTVMLTKQCAALPEEERRQLKPAMDKVSTYMMERITRPRVEIPEDIYADVMSYSYSFGAPARVIDEEEISVNASLSLPEPEEVKPFNVDENAEVPTFSNTMAGFGNDLANAGIQTAYNIDTQQLIGGGKMQLGVKYTGSSPVGKNTDPRPYQNMSNSTLEVKMTAAMPLRLAIDAIAQAYVRKHGGKDAAQDSQVVDEIAGQITYELQTLVEEQVPALAGSLLSVPLFKLATACPELLKVLGFPLEVLGKVLEKPLEVLGKGAMAVAEFAEKYINLDDAAYDLNTKILVNFDNGRFSSFAVASNTSTRLSISSSDAAPLPVKIGFDLSTSVDQIDHSVYPRPSIDTMLARMSELRDVNNEELTSHFLLRNQKGIERLMRTASDAVEDQAIKGDKYFQADRADMAERLDQVQQILSRVAGSTSELSDAAQGLKKQLDELLPRIKSPDPEATPKETLGNFTKLCNIMTTAFDFEVQEPQLN